MPINFDGTDDCINLSTPANLRIVTDYSISAWVFAGGAGNRTIFCSGDTAGAHGYSILFKLINTGGIRLTNNRAAGGNPTSTGTVSNGVWTHVGASFDISTNTATFYINGLQDSTDTTTDDPVGNGTGNILIGCRVDTPDTNRNQFFQGDISEVAVWDTLLTDTDFALLGISKLKQMSLQIKTAGLQGYWGINDGPHGTSADGNTVYDFSSFSNNGIGDNGANNTGLLWEAEQVLSYPPYIMTPQSIAEAVLIAERGPFRGINRGIQRGI